MKQRALSLSLVSVAAMVTAASAQPKPPAPKPPTTPVAVKAVRACGSAVPLSVGNSWTYEPIAPPADRVLSDAQQKSTPFPPKKLVIKVTDVATKDGVTTVTLSEDLDGRVHTSTVTCGAGGADFRVSPNGFWFAGEPGTTFGIELSDVVRKGHTLELVGGKLAGLEWNDDFEAKWKHTPAAKALPTLRSGTISIGRHFVLQVPEQVSSKVGSWKAAKLGVEVTTKVTIEPATKNPLKEIPLQVNFVYLVDGVGYVQALNSFGQMYILTELTVL